MRKFFTTLISLVSVLAFSQVEETNDSIIFEEEYDVIEIKEVLIQAQRKKMHADKAIYTFDKSALEKARYAKDLLSSLPELQVDHVSNTITSIKGGNTLILINGIEATDMQIRSVKLKM